MSYLSHAIPDHHPPVVVSIIIVGGVIEPMHGLTFHCFISPLSSSLPSFLWLQHQKYGDLPIIYFALARQIPNMFVSAAARTARKSQTTLTKACFVKPHPKFI